MSRTDTTGNGIIALAYFHRYGWIAAIICCVAIFPERLAWIISIGAIAFSIWSLVGYRLKWRHIYCSYQNAYHQKMTPFSVRWHQIKKADAYGVPLIFLLLGVLWLCIGILY